MKTYIQEKIIKVNSSIAWEALQKMNEWLPALSTIKKVEYETSEEFFRLGRKYKVYTPEGPVMNSEITLVDTKNLTIHIHAQTAILTSELTCHVIPVNACCCKIVRTQTYTGLVGFIFTTFFNKREALETSEYVTIWEEYAMGLYAKK